MEHDILIDVQNVSKRFCKDLKRSIRYGFMDSLRAITGRNLDALTLRKDEFWAVKDVSFQLRRGECMGLIGHNGAGKSTLLKMLNGLINPDHGSITMRGRIGALIELGAGFNPILTGRENIYNNGAVLGFSCKEIDAKIEEIIDFAEIREFIDSPVQNYSSGMRVRLGFAVAAQMEPDVLLIDEVLAVGDIGYTVKCLSRIAELLKTCAVIFVSHSMAQVGKICTSAMLLKHGQCLFSSNNVTDIIQAYYLEFDSEKSNFFTNGKAKLDKICFNSNTIETNEKSLSNLNEDITIEFDLLVSKDISKYIVFISFNSMELRAVALISRAFDSDNTGGNGFINQHIKAITKNIFSPGIYTIVIEVIELTGPNKDKFGEYLISLRNFHKVVSVGSNLTTYCPIQMNSHWDVNAI